MKNYKIKFESLPWEIAISGARFKAYKEGNKKIRLVEFTEKFIEPDWCEKGHIGYVLSGKMEIDFNGQIVSYEEGDGIFIPSGENHKHMAKVHSGTVQLVLIEEA